MKRIAISIMTIVLFSTLSVAQQHLDSYPELWQKVQQLESEKLPKSALRIVEIIYTKSKKEHNTAQLTKSLIHKSKFSLTLEEDARLHIVKAFKHEIAMSEFPTKNILESVLANLYWQYFQQNRYQFYNRSMTKNKVDATDFRTWDLQTLFREIHIHFQNSLKNGLEAQQTGLERFDDILELQKDSKKYRPTLFDFLTHNALEFYKTKETAITNPAYKFEISKKEFLANSDVFAALQFELKDSLSLQLNALKLFQKLVTFHAKKNTNAFIAVELERLKFVHRFATFHEKESIYLKSLHALKERFVSDESSTLIDFEIAILYNAQANTYKPLSATKNQFKRAQAFDICNEAILKFPNSPGAEKCKILRQEIKSSTLSITSEKHLPVQKHSKVLVSYKNIEKLFFNIYRISEKESEKLKKIYNNEHEIKFINNLELVTKFNVTLKTENDYHEHTTEIVIPPLGNGKYLIYTSTFETPNSNSIYATSIIQSTDIAVIEDKRNDINIYQIVNRNSGKPLIGAKVNFKNYNTGRFNDPINLNYTSDRNGQIKFKTTNSFRNVVLTVRYNKEIAFFGDFYLSERRNSYEKPENVTIHSFLFTDRSIYRPGQTVYYKGIFIEKNGSNSAPFANKSVKASLYNVNNEKINEFELQTNEFGAVSGAFILPNNGLLGQYSIRLSAKGIINKYAYISVEEYKRPKFEVAFEPVIETYKINDSITVKGTAIAFAGNNISNGSIKYRVHRKIQFPRWFYWNRPNFMVTEPQEITHGEAFTDAQGNFNITFKALPDKNINISDLPIFTYEISASVTAMNGETRSAETNVKIGYHALTAQIIIDDSIDKNNKENSLSIVAKNLNNEIVPAKGIIRIYKLIAPKNVLRKRPWSSPDYQLLSKEEFKSKFPHEAFSKEDDALNWKKGELVFETEFETSNAAKIELKRTKKWISGKYIIELEAKDKFDQTVTDKQLFTVFSNADKKVSDNQLFIISTDKITYKPNENVLLKIGSASKDISITIAVEKDHRIIETNFIHLNNEIKVVKIPVTLNDYGGFAIHYSFTNINSFESGTLAVAVPYPIKELEIETIRFRDKLQPGQNETWSFRLKGNKNEKIAAELLASMYDASLDQFKSHQWKFTPLQKPIYYSYNNSNASRSFGNVRFIIKNLSRSRQYYPQQYFDRLNWFGLSFFDDRLHTTLKEKQHGIFLNENSIRISDGPGELDEVSFSSSPNRDALVVENEEDSTHLTSSAEDPMKFSQVRIRKNFNETAFFFPHLTTDATGNISFNFKVPEALTRWKLQLLAHTKDLATATKTLTSVTQKELMVLPNLPRFLRDGDNIVFSNKISNLTKNRLIGIATLQISDAITGKTIDQKLISENSIQHFAIDANGNTNVSWTLQIPRNIQAIQYKVIAKAGDFSDGEQHVLPILSNRMMVTETLPMWITGNETKTFNLRKLKNNTSATLKNHKLTLEITSNPTWYAVQSLPYLMEYSYECSEQIFSRYYANALANHIVQANPRIQEVFNQWKTNDAILSDLEKNPDLKSIIIQETPWLRDAQSETEQKKRIALLFDLNKMNNDLESAINKLKKLQFGNGGFPWFNGGRYPNRFITQHIATGFGHLKKLGVIPNKGGESTKLISRAVQFLDTEILADYKKVLKEARILREKEKTKQKGEAAESAYLAKNHLSNSQLHYLYMRSFFAELMLPNEVQAAIDYYTNQSSKYWKNFNLFSKGMIALIHFRNENSSLANVILESLKENSIVSEEMGMYWKENSPGLFWYQSPVETQSLLIEAFAEIQNDNATVDALKVWLLKNKQTNQWKTTKATTDAVYALLLQGNDWLAVNESLEVTVGTKIIEPSKLENVRVEAGTGYFKTVWNGNEITPTMGEITISKTDEGIVWGALYWQYFEDLDKITSARTPLNLTKKLFLKSNTDKGQQLTEISESSTLKVGDLITVRVELKVDRTMEFVHMKDMRASGLEPINTLSQFKWQDGLGYYESTKDASTNFFIEYLPKGVYVFEYDLRVNNSGNFSNGITTIQSMYAPEFSSHSEGIKILVK
jgi:uncharacterized protein YfaS (alpha-2-macroglobulin family)